MGQALNEQDEHILSLSYGKDSLACLGAIEELGWPLERIVTAEVWATDTIPADPPPMMEFKGKADDIILERWGIRAEHIRHKLTYEKMFYRPICRGPRKGVIKGFPLTCNARSWCKNLKVSDQISKMGITYVGIAADEPNRFHNLHARKRSPLVEAGWTEAMCREWCEENGLLSPIYTDSARGGCWFCHNQGVEQLRLLRKKYPKYWALLLKWDEDSQVSFKAPSKAGEFGHTVHDYEQRFQMEDDHIIFADDRNFKWSMLDEELNYRLF